MPLPSSCTPEPGTCRPCSGQVGAVAIEIWTMDDGYFFDNVVVSNSVEEAAAVRTKTWAPKKELEVRGEGGRRGGEAVLLGQQLGACRVGRPKEELEARRSRGGGGGGGGQSRGCAAQNNT